MKIISQLIWNENSAIFVTTYNIWACSVEATQVKNLVISQRSGQRGDREGSPVSRGPSLGAWKHASASRNVCVHVDLDKPLRVSGPRFSPPKNGREEPCATSRVAARWYWGRPGRHTAPLSVPHAESSSESSLVHRQTFPTLFLLGKSQKKD